MGRRIHVVSTVIEPPAGEWLDTPFPHFTEGTPASYDLTEHLRSEGVNRNVALESGVIPPGVALVNDDGSQALVYDGAGPPITATNIVLSSTEKPPVDPPPPDPDPTINHAADWFARSRARGVFFATNCVERIEGAKDEATGYEFTDAFGRVGRQVSTETSLSLGIPAGTVLYPDGFGKAFIEVNGGPGGFGHARVQRRVFRWGSQDEDDFNVRPCEFIPVNYFGGRDSVSQAPLAPGEVGLRYDLQGVPRKYIETEVQLPIEPKTNTSPSPRHFYIQFLMKMNRSMMWGRWRNWTTPRDKNTYKMVGADPNVWQNKVFFLNGGYSTDQVFLAVGNKTGVINLKGTYGDSFRGFSKYIPFLGASSLTAAERWPFNYPNIDTGSPAADSTTPGDVMMTRYGPNNALMTRRRVDSRDAPLPGATPFPLDINDGGQYMTYTEAAQLGLDPYTVNHMSAPWRGFPYGGFDWNLRKTYPLLTKSDDVWAGVMEPDQWHVIEILFSEQYDAPVNQGGQVGTPTKNPLKYRLAGLWAAPYGKAPKCLGYLGQGADPPTGAIPNSWATTDNNGVSRANTQLKYQDANSETTRDMGARIVGSETPGCQDPTTTVLYMYRSNSARMRPQEGGIRTSTKYLDVGTGDDASRGQFDWGIKEGCMIGGTFGFTNGTLVEDAYDPPEMAGYTRSLLKYYHQAIVANDEVVRVDGAIVYVPDPIGGTLRSVHKITLENPLPAVPAIGDGVNFNASSDKYGAEVYNIPGCGERRLYHSQIIASCDWIPFPGHPNVQPERPWENP